MLIRKIMSWLAVYGLLTAGSVLFAIPFLWMASTSVKVDRELFSGEFRLMPLSPRPRAVSPYVDESYYPMPEGEKARQVIAGLRRLVGDSGFTIPADVDRARAEETIARGLYKKLMLRLPADVWDGSAESICAAAARDITPEMMTEAFGNTYRHLDLGLLLVRSQNLEEEELGEGMSPNVRFDNLTPDVATLSNRTEQRRSFAVVNYDFARGDRVVLTRTFTLGFAAENLQRIQLYLRPDDTWHELWLTVEKDGKYLAARRPLVLGNSNWLTATWQEPGPDDASLKMKTWMLLDPVRGKTSTVTDPHQVKLTLEVRRVSQQHAWANKLRYNYQQVLDQIPFWRYVRVSVFLVIMNVLLAVIISSLVAYAFARLQWPGRDFAFLLMLATLMIPGQVTMIPHFLIWRSVGAYDTLTPLWLGPAFGSAFFIFLLRQTLKGIPRDLEDAARIDGCGFLRIYWHIMLPLIKPSLAAIAIFTFMGTWNDFMGPLVYLSDQRLYPLAFGLYAFAVQVSNNPALTMAAALLMTLPVIAIFFFAQKYFIQGITLTGMKG